MHILDICFSLFRSHLPQSDPGGKYQGNKVDYFSTSLTHYLGDSLDAERVGGDEVARVGRHERPHPRVRLDLGVLQRIKIENKLGGGI